MNGSASRVTALLEAWSAGDLNAREQLMALVHGELRRRAAAQLRRERRTRTLQPTELVNEAFLRLVDQGRRGWRNREQFFGIASDAMRRILIDRARAHRAQKRAGQWRRVTLDTAIAAATGVGEIDVLDLDTALTELASFDGRKSRVIELLFFGGLTLPEIGRVLGISRATVEREWQAARAWLFDRLSRSPGS